MKKELFTLATMLLLAVGCTSVTKSMRSEVASVNESEYEILGEVEGVGESTMFLCFKKPIAKLGSIQEALPGVSLTSTFLSPTIFSYSSLWDAQGLALNDAMSKAPEAESLICPVFEIAYTHFILGDKTHVKVKAIAVRRKR